MKKMMMKKKSDALAVAVVVALFGCCLFSSVANADKMYHVYVQNDIQDPDTCLSVHVKSGDDDFGQRLVYPNEYFDWEFRMKSGVPNTLYFGFLDFKDITQGMYGELVRTHYHAEFDVFRNSFPAPVDPGHNVSWSIRRDGSYIWDLQTRSYYKMHDWQILPCPLFLRGAHAPTPSPR